MIRVLVGATGLAGAAATAGWFVLARIQGDSEIGFGPCTVMGTAEGSVHAEVELINRGREAGVIRKLEGFMVDGPPGPRPGDPQGQPAPAAGVVGVEHPQAG